ncbi:hypothetical protein AB0M48_38645 [Lentzea sp. NPDC051208]|uniref:hypothetical protein n=1 Tax=Lentzea sp. NPDC051208 TaxID=3154642 RepID=UPI00342EF1B8
MPVHHCASHFTRVHRQLVTGIDGQAGGSDLFVQQVQVMLGAEFVEGWRRFTQWTVNAFDALGVDLEEASPSDGSLAAALAEVRAAYLHLTEAVSWLLEVQAWDRATLLGSTSELASRLVSMQEWLRELSAAAAQVDLGRIDDLEIARLSEHGISQQAVTTVLSEMVSSGVARFESWAAEFTEQTIAAESGPSGHSDAEPEAVPPSARRGKTVRFAPSLEDQTRTENQRLERRRQRKGRAKQDTVSAARENSDPRLRYRRMDFEEVWNSPPAREDLGRFMRVEHNAEGFEFLEAVERYRRGETTAGQVYDMFIGSNAPAEVNLEDRHKRDIARNVKAGNEVPELFDVAYHHVKSMIRHDPFMRYTRSDPEVIAAKAAAMPPPAIVENVAHGASSSTSAHIPSSADGPAAAGAQKPAEGRAARTNIRATRQRIEIGFWFGSGRTNVNQRGELRAHLDALTTYLGVTRDHLERAKAEALERKRSGDKTVKRYVVRNVLGVVYSPSEGTDEGQVHDRWTVGLEGNRKVASRVRPLEAGKPVRYAQYGDVVVVDARPGDLTADLTRYAAAVEWECAGLATVTRRGGLPGFPVIDVEPLSDRQDRAAFEQQIRAVHPRARITWLDR